jgi:hypothetical protein
VAATSNLLARSIKPRKIIRNISVKGFLVMPSVAVRTKNRKPIAAGGLDDPAKQFREFAAECLELAQTTSSPEKHTLYLKMASVWHQMALRWEKKD